MLCETIRADSECTFMTPRGCSYNGGVCAEIVEQCGGCNRVLDISAGKYCASYPEPASKWKSGNCNLATHVTEPVAKAKVKINPLKASKRAKRNQ